MPREDETLRALADEHHALVSGENPFQRRARLRQALWREDRDLPMGRSQGGPQGAWLAMPAAKEQLSNYLTDAIRDVVRREVLDRKRSRGKLYGKPRIFNNLLSSQPLCFNLFAELQQDMGLATRAFRRLAEGRVHEVTAIEFEHSPGRRDPKYTGDRSAFDVYVEFSAPSGARGFVGIEVKYHEDLDAEPDPHRGRYDEIADEMGIFKGSARHKLRGKPLQQIWRDHLLAGSLLLDSAAGFEDGFFAFLYPKDNERCARAVDAYRACLTAEGTFVSLTLEEVVAAVREAGAGPWVELFADRYLGFDKVDALLKGSE